MPCNHNLVAESGIPTLEITMRAGERYATATVSHASGPLPWTPRLTHRYSKPATITTVATIPAVDKPRVTMEVLKAGKETCLNTNQAIKVTRPPPMAATAIPTKTPRKLVVSQVAGVKARESRTGVEEAGG